MAQKKEVKKTTTKEIKEKTTSMEISNEQEKKAEEVLGEIDKQLEVGIGEKKIEENTEEVFRDPEVSIKKEEVDIKQLEADLRAKIEKEFKDKQKKEKKEEGEKLINIITKRKEKLKKLTTIDIRPLPIKKWHKKEGKESFSQPKFIRANPSGTTNEYIIALDNEVLDYIDPVTEEPTTELKYYEKKLNISLNTFFNEEKPHPFYDGKMGRVKLENHTFTLNLKNPIQYVHYKIVLASKKVANSYAEWEAGLYPDATHYIYDKNIVVKTKYKKLELKKRARKIVEGLSRMDKVKMILVIEKENLRSHSDEDIEIAIDELITSKPQEIIAVSLQKNLSEQAIILEAIERGILKNQAGTIYYFDTVIGMDIEDAARYLAQPTNSEFKLTLNAQLKM